MSLRPNGTYACDRCGNDIGNAGYLEALTLCGMDPENEQAAWCLHLCVANCRDLVLTTDALADYHQNRA